MLWNLPRDAAETGHHPGRISTTAAKPRRRRPWLAILVAGAGTWLAMGPQTATADETYMVKARVAGKFLEGRPLSESSDRVLLLSRDGQLLDFNPAEARDYQRSSPRFISYPQSEIRAQLYQEFGADFDVSGTGHYLVVHPRGQGDLWAQRFEDLYRSFNHYFRVRDFDLVAPPYPLVAIVFRSEQEYQQYSQSMGSNLGPNMLGHYSPRTNRIALYDTTAGDADQDWTRNAETIIHEATHQTAFNTGVHTRFAEVPRWVSEGLATMFEAEGVWSFAGSSARHERVNNEQLRAFKTYATKRRKKSGLASLISSDTLFRTDLYGAYSEAWALSFYLSETRPHDYARYMKQTAARDPFSAYGGADRMADFQRHFGEDMVMFENNYLRWTADLLK
jgi:hypothetical protein